MLASMFIKRTAVNQVTTRLANSLEDIWVQLEQHAPQGTEIAFVFQKQCFYGSLRPVLHGIGQHLHGHVVPTQVVPYKEHPLYSLCVCEQGGRKRVNEPLLCLRVVEMNTCTPICIVLTITLIGEAFKTCRNLIAQNRGGRGDLV